MTFPAGSLLGSTDANQRPSGGFKIGVGEDDHTIEITGIIDEAPPPAGPVAPVDPGWPCAPEGPGDPVAPVSPFDPAGPAGPVAPGGAIHSVCAPVSRELQLDRRRCVAPAAPAVPGMLPAVLRFAPAAPVAPVAPSDLIRVVATSHRA